MSTPEVSPNPESPTTSQLNSVDALRQKSLAIAETIDMWRMIPRALVITYAIMVGYLVNWFMAIETFTKKTCDSATILKLIEKGIPPDQVQAIACTITDVVGGPTTTQTTFVTTVVGLSTAIFGLYANSSKDWSKSVLPWNWNKK